MSLQNQSCKGHNSIITCQPRDYYDAQTDGNPGPQAATSYRITPGVHTFRSLSIYMDPLTSIWLANNLQQMPVRNKMSLLGHKQLTVISMPEHKPWCHSVKMYHLLSMCHVHIKVRIKFSASEGLVSSFFNSILIMQGSVSSTYYNPLVSTEMNAFFPLLCCCLYHFNVTYFSATFFTFF
jgi:hypothetical protein